MPSIVAGSDRAPVACLSTIVDVSRRLGVTSRALRFYEDRGLIDSERMGRNIRAYDPKSVARIEMIVALRRADLSIAVIKRAFELEGEPLRQSAFLDAALEAVLVDQREQIDKTKALQASVRSLSDLPLVERLTDHAR